MKKVVYLLSFALILTVASCQKDKCAGVVCSNGGSCEDGNCKCTAGFTGAKCETHTDACDTIICYYGGACLSGTCHCQPHTSGPNCATLEAPVHIYITGITINQY